MISNHPRKGIKIYGCGIPVIPVQPPNNSTYIVPITWTKIKFKASVMRKKEIPAGLIIIEPMLHEITPVMIPAAGRQSQKGHPNRVANRAEA